ncbi:MAG: AI-2E family transporter [Muribaculaceae bacterium]|nr:AI-2E family transporter [Muribaculaceae bacterium]
MEAATEAKKYDLDRVVRLVIALVCIAVAIYLINYLSSVLLPFLVGCVLAYMLNPIVEFFRKILFMKNRIIPSLLTLVVFFGAIFLIVKYLFPYLAQEVGEMSKMLSAYAQAELRGREIPVEITQFINDYLNIDYIKSLFTQEQWVDIFNQVVSGTWSFLGGTLKMIVTVVAWLLALLYMFFVMIDYDKITRGFKAAIPPRYRRTALRIMNDVTGTMSRYFRGQALVSLFVGIIFAIEFYIIGLPMAVVFGLSIGVLNMVPYLQLISLPVAAFLCLVASVATGAPFWPLWWWTFAAYCICQLIQDLVLIPLIMRQQMGLRPAIVFLALSIWSYVLGFVGLIVALPLTTLIISYYSEFVLHRPNPLYEKRRKKKNKKK